MEKGKKYIRNNPDTELNEKYTYTGNKKKVCGFICFVFEDENGKEHLFFQCEFDNEFRPEIRKLKAIWTVESEQDLQTFYGIKI